MLISFKASHIISGDGMQIVRDSAIHVKDGRILSIGQRLKEATVVDLGHVLLSPMFINAHCHLGDTGAKELGVGLPLEQVVVPPNGLKHRFLAGLDQETHIQQMRHGLTEMLANGIIACADFREQGLAGVQALQKAAQELPVRVICLGRMTESQDVVDIQQEANEILEIADGLGIRDIAAYPIPVIQELRKVYPDKIIAMHVSENAEAEKKSHHEYSQGQTARALELSPDFLVHLTHTPEHELQLIAERKTYAVCCPRANGILGDGLPDVSAWVTAGVEFSIGSDNMMIASPDMFREMDYLSRMQRGLHQDPAVIDFHKIFSAATIQGARALKIDQDLGSLSPGKEASFLVMNLDSANFTFTHDYISSMVHRANITDICNIYIKGEKFV
ncbi:MAG: amidohydrolase family protein [Anaerolineaceae bacterium]|nr:amidohydrolase family protein [Anaerolineaceae bacterium]